MARGAKRPWVLFPYLVTMQGAGGMTTVVKTSAMDAAAARKSVRRSLIGWRPIQAVRARTRERA